jgi:hypothetical protein
MYQGIIFFLKINKQPNMQIHTRTRRERKTNC